jgi:hypothetical protein
MNNSLFGGIIIILLSVYSCENPVDTFEYCSGCKLYPIASDNNWTYESKFYGGGEVIPGLTDTLKVSIEAEIEIEIDNRIYNGGIEKRILGQQLVKWIYTNQDDGLYMLGGIARHDTSIQKILYYKYPVKEGESWNRPLFLYLPEEQRFEFNSDSLIKISCIQTKKEVVTNIGNFNCLVYHHRERPSEDVLEYWDYYFHYTPGVGLVKLEIKGSFDNRIIQTVTLVGYNLK